MHFTKALLVTAAAFAPFAFAADQAEDSPKTITIQVLSVDASTPTSSIPLIPSTTSIPVIATASSQSFIPSSSAHISTIKTSAPAQTTSPSEPSLPPLHTGAASALEFSGALAAGAMAVAGLLAL